MLETARLSLREPQIADVEIVRNYYRRNAHRFLPWEPVPADTTEDFSAWIAARVTERSGSGAASFLAFDRLSQSLVAIVNVNGHSADGGSSMISYTVDGAYEGRGLATEAVRFVIAFAATELGLRSLSAYFHPENVRSARLLERLGFKEVSRTSVVPGFEHLMRPNVLAILTDLDSAGTA